MPFPVDAQHECLGEALYRHDAPPIEVKPHAENVKMVLFSSWTKSGRNMRASERRSVKSSCHHFPAPTASR